MATKTTKLKGRDPSGVEPSKPKIVVYGPPGVGKTWASMDFPNVYYIDTEAGADLEHYRTKLKTANGLYFGPDEGALDFNEVIEQIKALATEKHDHKTLVIDSLSKLFNNQIAMTQEKMATAGTEDAFGASKKPAIAFMRRMVAWIQKLDMNVILIHHQKDKWKGGEVIGETFDGWEKLEYELHLALRIQKMGPARQAFVGKTRLAQFPEGTSFPWSFAEFAKRYGADVIGRAAVPQNLSSPEQQDLYRVLLSKVKVEQTVLDKWESTVPDIALLDSDTINARIEWLSKQLAAQTATAA